MVSEYLPAITNFAIAFICFIFVFVESNKLRNKRSELENFKQSTVAKYLGIEIDESKLHDAEYDIKVCIQIFNKL